MTRFNAVACVLCGMLALGLLWPGKDDVPDNRDIRYSPGQNDMAEYAAIAFNLVRHGAFTVRPPGQRAPETDPARMKREPVFPAYLAAVFATVPAFHTMSFNCLRDDACAAVSALRLRQVQAGAVVSAILVASTFAAGYAVTGSWIAAFLASALCFYGLRFDKSGNDLIALFLLMHSVSAFAVWRRPRMLTGALGGAALGLLILAEAVFQYWLPIFALVLAAGLWRSEPGANRRSRLLASAAMLVTASAFCLPWMVRNANYAGEFSVASGGGAVVAIRAEYGRMTWPEVRGAFAYWAPKGRAILKRWLKPENFSYSRFDRGNPEGFYRRAWRGGEEVAHRAREIRTDTGLSITDTGLSITDTGLSIDKARKRAALETIAEDWRKQLVLTLAFAWRGMNMAFGLPLMAGLASMVALALRRRDFSLLCLSLPVAWTFFFHAALTHFIPRYGEPFVATLAVISALAAREFLRPVSSLAVGAAAGAASLRFRGDR